MNSRKHRDCILKGSVLLSTALLIAGCTTTKTTTTARSATEELLLSTATDHALQKVGLEIFSGRRVFLDSTYFDSLDSKYVLGALRDAISRAGGMLADKAGDSDVIIEARSGALAMNQSDTMFGIPSMPIPVPLSGTLQTPEIAFYKSDVQRSFAKFALLAIATQSRAHVYSSGPLDGKSFDKHVRLIFVSWHRTDVPERAGTLQDAQKLQTYGPQYDPENLPGSKAPAK